jgi:hypothetical protein
VQKTNTSTNTNIKEPSMAYVDIIHQTFYPVDAEATQDPPENQFRRFVGSGT